MKIFCRADALTKLHPTGTACETPDPEAGNRIRPRKTLAVCMANPFRIDFVQRGRGLDRMTSPKRLSVLIVEDEAIIRVLLCDMIGELGHTIAGQAARVDEALALVNSPLVFDIAILDVNLVGETVEPIAAAIACRGLPFVFVTGYGESGVPERFRGRPFLEKPFAIADLSDVLQAVAGG
jgi:CheY-like chemotaxis protein